jgi:hypothetical protein
MMSKVINIEVGVPEIHVGGSGQSSPLGDRDTSKPPPPRGLKVDELTSELKVLKLQEKIAKIKKKPKSKKTQVQEVSSSSSSNEEGNGSSSDESIVGTHKTPILCANMSSKCIN